MSKKKVGKAPEIIDDVVVTREFMPPAEWGIYSLCYMQVCAHSEVPPVRIEARANALNPNGVTNPWRIASKGPNDETLAPVRCGQQPERIHYMLSC